MPIASIFVRILLCGMIVVFAGCATWDPVAIGEQTRGKALVIATTVGGKLHLTWIGTTVFNNEYGSQEIGHWKAAESAQTIAVQELSTSGRYASVDGITGVIREGKTAPKVPDTVKGDYLLLIEETPTQDIIWNTSQMFLGLGVAQRSLLGLSSPAVAHASIRSSLHDLRSGQEVAATSEFDSWRLSIQMISGGKATMTGPSPSPVIREADLLSLREPMLAHFVDVVKKQLVRLGLR